MKHAQRRIVTLATLGILVTGALVGLATAWPLYQGHRQGLETVTLMSASAQAESLDHLLARYRDVARQIASRSELRRRLEAYLEDPAATGEGRDALADDMAPTLVDAMLPSTDLVGLVRRDPAGRPLVTIGRVPPARATDATRPADETRLVAAQEGLLIEVTTPVLSRDGQRLGSDRLYFGARGSPRCSAIPVASARGPVSGCGRRLVRRCCRRGPVARWSRSRSTGGSPSAWIRR